MARHALENPTRHRSQMSGEQRKRSASKKSARAIAASHRRQADASYEAMLEAEDDAWEGGEYQGRYAYDAYKNPRMETINVVVESGGKTTAAFSLKADVDALWDHLKDEYRDETDRLWSTVRRKMSGGPSRSSRVQFDWPSRTLTFYTTRSNPFHVTPGGTVTGTRERTKEDYLLPPRYGRELEGFHRDVAFRAAELEAGGSKVPRILEVRRPGAPKPEFLVRVPGRKDQYFRLRQRAQRYLESVYTGVPQPAKTNPFLVTLGGQAVGVPDYSNEELWDLHERGLTIPVRGRQFNRSHHRRAAAGAASLEEEGFTLTIKKVGDEYRIFDNHGNDLQKYAYRLEKAQEILEKILAKQA